MAGRELAIPDVDYFDCTDKEDGRLYAHPWDVTRFLVCDNGRAHDKSCPACSDCKYGNESEDGWMRFNESTQSYEHNNH